jgi:hypothetical protein
VNANVGTFQGLTLDAKGRVTAAANQNYQTAAQVSAVLPVASSTPPLMDGTVAVGTGTTWARADHVHASDTSRYAATNPAGYQTAAQVSAALTPYAPLASPALTGVPLAPTAAGGTSTTQLATTAFVGSAVNTIPGVTNGTNAAAGVVGEYIESLVGQSVPLAVTSSAAFNLTQLTLTAGDWYIYGNITYIPSGATMTSIWAAISTTSAGFPDRALWTQHDLSSTGDSGLVAPSRRFLFSVTTIVYLVGLVIFSPGTCAACGQLAVRRAR